MAENIRYNEQAGRYQNVDTGKFVRDPNVSSDEGSSEVDGKFLNLLESLNKKLSAQIGFLGNISNSLSESIGIQTDQKSLLERLVGIQEYNTDIQSERSEDIRREKGLEDIEDDPSRDTSPSESTTDEDAPKDKKGFSLLGGLGLKSILAGAAALPFLYQFTKGFVDEMFDDAFSDMEKVLIDFVKKLPAALENFLEFLNNPLGALLGLGGLGLGGLGGLGFWLKRRLFGRPVRTGGLFNSDGTRGQPRNSSDPRGQPRNSSDPRGQPRNSSDTRGQPRNTFLDRMKNFGRGFLDKSKSFLGKGFNFLKDSGNSLLKRLGFLSSLSSLPALAATLILTPNAVADGTLSGPQQRALEAAQRNLEERGITPDSPEYQQEFEKELIELMAEMEKNMQNRMQNRDSSWLAGVLENIGLMKSASNSSTINTTTTTSTNYNPVDIRNEAIDLDDPDPLLAREAREQRARFADSMGSVEEKTEALSQGSAQMTDAWLAPFLAQDNRSSINAPQNNTTNISINNFNDRPSGSLSRKKARAN